MDPTARTLKECGDRLFAARPLSLWQVLAENFNPMRADFMVERTIDDEIITGLMSSVPVLFNRELSESLGTNMRPRAVDWFDMHVPDLRIDEASGPRSFLEYVTKVQRRAMYDKRSGFVRAMKELDGDWTTIGNAVVYVGVSHLRDALLYQNFHVRDCAWSEGPNHIVDTMHRNWSPTLRQLCQMFPKTVHPSCLTDVKNEPERTIQCRHIVIPRDNYVYNSKAKGQGDFISLHIDLENEIILEEVAQNSLRYVVPRWMTVSSSPFGRSPVTEIMFPDAKMLQTLSRIIMEAGEKAVDPPIVAAEEVFRSDFDVRSGGLTWAELEADQKLSDKIDVLSSDKNGIPIGIELLKGIIQSLSEGFYINKLKMPPAVREFTAYELRKRLQEHIRDVTPLYDPYEEEVNGPVCDETFMVLSQHKAFGDLSEMPEELKGADASFTFYSPLRDAERELDAHIFMEGLNLVAMAGKIDPAQIKQVKMTPAVRDSLKGMRWKETWLEDPKVVDQAVEQNAQKQQAMEAGMMAGGAGQAAEQVGKGGQEVKKALTGDDQPGGAGGLAGLIQQLGAQGGSTGAPPPGG